MNKQTRRDFLACTGIGALGMLAGGETAFAGTMQSENKPDFE